MQTTAVRLYGKKDLRLETFELPEITEGEILARIVSDSICMSSYKASDQGPDHKRIPDNVAENPIIIGHEFCGEIVQVGKRWKNEFTPGEKFSIQPAMNDPEGPVGVLSAPGYSFPYIGGDAQYIVIPASVMERKCLLPYAGEAFYLGSLAEPMSCVIGAFHANYHTSPGSYEHRMGIVEGGATAILAGVGPMGLAAIDYALHCDRKPGLLVVTDIDNDRLARAASFFSVEEAAKEGIKLIYLNTAEPGIDTGYMKSLTPGGEGFDDVFVFAPVRPLVEQADLLLANDGCLNFFAGPSDPAFKAEFNFYNVHYAATHVVGTSGGNTNDMIESLKLMEAGRINPSTLVTHIGGLDAVIETTLHLPEIPGGKKLIYTGISLPLTPLAELGQQTDPMLQELAHLVEAANGLWSPAAEQYLLAHAKPIH